jgi:hypothetical protein
MKMMNLEWLLMVVVEVAVITVQLQWQSLQLSPFYYWNPLTM